MFLYPYLPLQKDYPVINRVVPSATVSGTSGVGSAFSLPCFPTHRMIAAQWVFPID